MKKDFPLLVPSKKNIVIFGNYGGANWGDEAILDGLLSAIPQDKFHIIVISSAPDLTKKICQVSAVLPPPFGIRSFFTRFSSFFPFLRALKQARFVVFGGGGLFQDREKKAVYLWSYYFFWSWLLRKRSIFVAQSVGPLNDRASRYLVHWVFSKIPFVSLRDSASCELLTTLGIENKKLVQSTDAVFLLKKMNIRQKRCGTLLMLRGDGKLSAKRIINLYKYLPHPITAVPMDAIDLQFSGQLETDVWIPDHVDALRRKIACAEIVISARLHGNLLSLLEGTPFIALAAAPKVTNYFSERGLADQVLPESFSDKEFVSSIQITLNNKEMLKKLLRVSKSERGKAGSLLPIFLQ